MGGFHNVAGPKVDSDETVESLALAGASAIQCLISDRKNLQYTTNTQQQELAGLRARNENLNRRLLLVRESYLELAAEFLSQIERFDEVLRGALGNQRESSTEATDATLIDLAQRFSPLEHAPRQEEPGKVS